MNNNLLNALLKARYYALACLLVMGLFAWTQVSGVRLLGDDTESVQNVNGHRSSSPHHGGRSYFYHK